MNEVDGWELYRVSEYEGKKEKKYTFRSFEVIQVDGYNARKLLEIRNVSEEAAWTELENFLMEKSNDKLS